MTRPNHVFYEGPIALLDEPLYLDVPVFAVVDLDSQGKGPNLPVKHRFQQVAPPILVFRAGHNIQEPTDEEWIEFTAGGK